MLIKFTLRHIKLKFAILAHSQQVQQYFRLSEKWWMKEDTLYFTVREYAVLVERKVIKIAKKERIFACLQAIKFVKNQQ